MLRLLPPKFLLSSRRFFSQSLHRPSSTRLAAGTCDHALTSTIFRTRHQIYLIRLIPYNLTYVHILDISN